MSYRAAHDEILQKLLAKIVEVDSYESALDFNAHAARLIQAEAAKTHEFYPGEFLSIFRVAFEGQSRVIMDSCKQTIDDAKVEVDLAKVELTERLKKARAINDREARAFRMALIGRDKVSEQEQDGYDKPTNRCASHPPEGIYRSLEGIWPDGSCIARQRSATELAGNFRRGPPRRAAAAAWMRRARHRRHRADPL
jgi:hypothetical protein